MEQLAGRLQEAGPTAKVSIEVQDDGRVKLNVDKLGALGEPKSLTWLRQQVEKMLPKIDLPDLLFDGNASTEFLVPSSTSATARPDEGPAHLGGRAAVVRGVQTSASPVVNHGYEALTRGLRRVREQVRRQLQTPHPRQLVHLRQQALPPPAPPGGGLQVGKVRPSTARHRALTVHALTVSFLLPATRPSRRQRVAREIRSNLLRQKRASTS
ncbi:hypothetical protein PV664_34205 [Streptomyces sp. ME01-18a]|nr:hypothetical protein [Streptomyces sp. ME01-18a]MDX3433933.1 hypothetical protein [Streptomyces sp. ME01-18a]